MTKEEKEHTGKYVLQMARLLEDGCYQQEMLLKAVRIIDEVLEQEPITKNDLGVDCISREDARSLICNIDIKHHVFGMSRKVFKDLYNGMDDLPSVTQEPCDKCEVGNPCLYCKHEFEPQEARDK